MAVSVTSVQARVLSGCIADLFRAYAEYSDGELITQEVRTAAYEVENRFAYGVNCDECIAPFDLSAIQHVRTDILPTDYVGVYDIQIELTRLSVDIANRKRVNRLFL